MLDSYQWYSNSAPLCKRKVTKRRGREGRDVEEEEEAGKGETGEGGIRGKKEGRENRVKEGKINVSKCNTIFTDIFNDFVPQPGLQGQVFL